ncbi:MAG TPA: hypothetical protein VLF71_00965 [Candidatus Saccharimonadales bacterium]|nr:hypothetical protein [Candidatus Saccharimonadales bacterium]
MSEGVPSGLDALAVEGVTSAGERPGAPVECFKGTDIAKLGPEDAPWLQMVAADPDHPIDPEFLAALNTAAEATAARRVPAEKAVEYRAACNNFYGLFDGRGATTTSGLYVQMRAKGIRPLRMIGTTRLIHRHVGDQTPHIVGNTLTSLYDMACQIFEEHVAALVDNGIDVGKVLLGSPTIVRLRGSDLLYHGRRVEREQREREKRQAADDAFLAGALALGAYKEPEDLDRFSQLANRTWLGRDLIAGELPGVAAMPDEAYARFLSGVNDLAANTDGKIRLTHLQRLLNEPPA